MMSTVGSSTTPTATSSLSMAATAAAASHNNIGSSNNALNNNVSSSSNLTDGMQNNVSSATDNGMPIAETTEDLNTLEAEISELQRENARVESQMMRLKSDINAMESQLCTSDRESAPLSSHQQRTMSTMNSNGGQTAFAAVSSSTPATTISEGSSPNVSHSFATSVISSEDTIGKTESTASNNTYATPLANMSGPPDNTAAPTSSLSTSTTTSTSTPNLNNYYESLRNNVITLLEHVRLPASAGHQNSISGTTSVTSNSYVSTPMSGVATNQHNSYVGHPTLIPPSPLSTASIAASNAGLSLYGGTAHHLTTSHPGHALGPPPPHTSAVGSTSSQPHPYTVHHTAAYAPHDHFDSYISKLQSLCVPPDVYALPEDVNRPVYDTVKSSLHHQDYTLMPTPI